MDYQQFRRDRCWCDCHRLSNIAPAEPPLRTDAVAAVWACKRCENNHIPALTYQPPPEPVGPWVDLAPPPAADATGDGEGQADDGN